MTHTPVTYSGLLKYDHLPALQAILRAWNEPGDAPAWHARRKAEVRASMPVLAHTLDRATQEKQ